ncbi:hypothetical protein [Aestuariispira insulae]|uniref:Catalase n=1 Tax=Aestuariispira insulae TaxID=1461337 RepID=A0A3D9HIS3_9PROT|nr:hypothetical protein [Aestuariispira insulae]RED49171.1 hypothetical protein DFP90_106149 [Aestuariispira insulae]
MSEATDIGGGFEEIPPNEESIISAIVDDNFKTLAKREGVTQRGQHGKHHGCLSACFIIRDDLPDHLKHGIFARPDRFKAWVRLSNGTWYDDRKADAHGMSIKLEGVTGEHLGFGAPNEQDFLLVDHPVFFTRSLEEYRIFNRYFTRILAFLKKWKDPIRFLPRLFWMVQGWLMLRLCHGGMLRRSQAFASASPVSLLTSCYWSTTPYAHGDDLAVKYMVRPIELDRAGPLPARGNGAAVISRNGFSEDLAKRLADKGWQFEFGIHLHRDPESHPIEDATVHWDPEGTAFIPLARIVIDAHDQTAVAQSMSRAEQLAFSPWNGLVAHRPLGHVNRARRDVYLEMARRRLEANRP